MNNYDDRVESMEERKERKLEEDFEETTRLWRRDGNIALFVMTVLAGIVLFIVL